MFNTIMRVLTNSWFAGFVLVIAGASLYLLHERGKVTEAIVGSVLLVIAALLIFLGTRRKSSDDFRK
ncbi:hypothetical protein [Desulfomonile tiedjei]|uniref:Uncharacterized protein n=1 Tax=Desulfomonile tiedjei (strain ATCC 49306 / DSM 6799 / DCB-1) TaxID=706587 RepID=I4C7C8_DESTA|nr:hypothetical protein [Desulfomonile tiedjei]AFM25469.1 hypothetical protein Desti_2799 [Desulfomonile tiedjei DSM 6799]